MLNLLAAIGDTLGFWLFLKRRVIWNLNSSAFWNGLPDSSIFCSFFCFPFLHLNWGFDRLKLVVSDTFYLGEGTLHYPIIQFVVNCKNYFSCSFIVSYKEENQEFWLSFFFCIAADILLWKQRHVSFGFVVVATVFWLLIEHSGLPLLTTCSDVLLILVVLLFLRANFAAFRNKYVYGWLLFWITFKFLHLIIFNTILFAHIMFFFQEDSMFSLLAVLHLPFLCRQLQSLPQLVLSEELVNNVAASVRAKINNALLLAHDITLGNDFKLFFRVSIWSTIEGLNDHAFDVHCDS